MLLSRYRLALLLEEPYHHSLLFGGKQRAAGSGDDAPHGSVSAIPTRTWSASSMEDEILAIGQMQGCGDNPTIPELLQALIEYHRSCIDR